MSKPTRSAFTLVELLVVIAIIGILVSLLLLCQCGSGGRSTNSMQEQHQTGLGSASSCSSTARSEYPQGRNSRDPMGVSVFPSGCSIWKKHAIFDSYDDTVRVDDDANATAMRSRVDLILSKPRESCCEP